MSSNKYAWRNTRSFKFSAQEAGEELERIEKKYGEITPRYTVDESKPEDATLHQFFEWDNEKAGDNFRLVQARSLIRCVTVSAFGGEEAKSPVPAFVNLRSTNEDEEEDGRSYVHIVTAMSDAEKREQILSQARKEIREWRHRYDALSEFSKLFKLIDKLAA